MKQVIHITTIMVFFLFNTYAISAVNCEIDSNDTFSGVVRLESPRSKACTGSLIMGGKFILTAAHCVTEANKVPKVFEASKLAVYIGHDSKNLKGVVKSVVIPSYYIEYGENDIALIELNEPITRAKSYSLDFNVNQNSPVIVGGFGKSNSGHSAEPKIDGTRKMGINKVGSVDDKYICLEEVLYDPEWRLPKNSNFCHPSGGDSGSSIFQNEKIVGVFVKHRETWNSDGTTLAIGCAINLNNPKIKDFLLLNLIGNGKNSSVDKDFFINNSNRGMIGNKVEPSLRVVPSAATQK